MSDSLQPYGLVAHQTSLSMEFFRQEYWSRFPFPSPGDLPDLEIESLSFSSPCIGRQVLYLERPPYMHYYI